VGKINQMMKNFIKVSRAGDVEYARSVKTASTPAVVFCGVLFLLIALLVGTPVCAQPVKELPTVEIKDIDNDNLPDASIETSKTRVIISSRDGEISSYYLKGHNFEENIIPPLLLDYGYNVASDTLRPFSGEMGSVLMQHFGYRVALDERSDGRVTISATPNVSGTASDPGVNLGKKYTFHANRYSFEIQLIATNLGDAPLQVGDDKKPGLIFQYGPGLFLDPFDPTSFVALKSEGHEFIVKPEDVLKKGDSGGFTGIGLKSNYFCVLMDAKTSVKLQAKTMELKPADSRRKTFSGSVIGLSFPSFVLKPKESKEFSFQMYLGPKILDELTTIHREAVTDYGFLSTILLRILQTFNAVYPNYGLSIIFLTVLVRILLYPLTLKSTKSMAQVQKIQPLVQDLKDRYRDNTQRFNEEVLKLYQKHEVNPLGGCLPMLLQLPILIALYNTINIAVELRKTPFLWMTDLSKADPFMILPFTIAAMMYYQQGKMPDTQQQQMMLFMPVFMFAITWGLPAGLLVYWFTSSVIGILQQIQANKIIAAIKEE